MCVRVIVCVLVCVCVRERDRDRERQRETERETFLKKIAAYAFDSLSRSLWDQNP